ncbi:MAG: hypothetical protein JSR48_04165 [Verrucomicrobia bacterium]|nr:hypothetical protein [Verrucomicrobiota bacterium]
MKPRRNEKASVVLVAMCFVAVLAISLAGYMAVGSQSTRQSTRAYLRDVSLQLAQIGLERALNAFATSSFSSWTRPNSTTATKTVTIAGSRYGTANLTANVYIRVDRYREPPPSLLTGTPNRGNVWSAQRTYAVGDFVYYLGVWYLCYPSAPAAGVAPSNIAYWTSAPDIWNPYATYQIGNVALYGGAAYRCAAINSNMPPGAATIPTYWSLITPTDTWVSSATYLPGQYAISGAQAYRCLAANTNQAPPNAAYWASATGVNVGTWNAANSYAIDAVVFAGGVPYRCIAANSNKQPPNTTYWLSPPVIYAQGTATLPDNTGTTISTQLRAIVAPAPLFTTAAGAYTYTNLASGGIIDSYNAAIGTYASQVSGSGSTYTQYTNYSATLAGGNTSGTAVNLNTATLRGYVSAPAASTSPYAPRWTYSGSGAVLGPNDSSGVNLTRINRSSYLPKFDVQAVTGGNNLPAGQGVGTILNQGNRTLGTPGTLQIYNITGTYYSGSSYTPGIYLNNSTDILNIIGPVILNVTGSFYISNGSLNISAGASLEVYFTDELYIGNNGSGGIYNSNADPKTLLIVGTSTVNSSGYHYLWTAADFYGVLYMPSAYIHLWNSGYTPQRYGALLGSNVYFNHTANQHYDTTLRTAGSIGTFIDSPYLVSELRLLSDPGEQVTLP